MDNTVGTMLNTPKASEPCLNQAHCMAGSMRSCAQNALNASVAIGCGTDMYEQDGQE